MKSMKQHKYRYLIAAMLMTMLLLQGPAQVQAAAVWNVTVKVEDQDGNAMQDAVVDLELINEYKDDPNYLAVMQGFTGADGKAAFTVSANTVMVDPAISVHATKDGVKKSSRENPVDPSGGNESFTIVFESNQSQEPDDNKTDNNTTDNNKTDNKSEKKSVSRSSSSEAPSPAIFNVVAMNGNEMIRALESSALSVRNMNLVSALYTHLCLGGQYTSAVLDTKDVLAPANYVGGTETMLTWKIDGVKAGDAMYAIQYIDGYGFVYLPAIAVEDGVVQVTVPNLYDISTISIARLLRL